MYGVTENTVHAPLTTLHPLGFSDQPLNLLPHLIRRVARGAFKTAVKIGRDWMISPDEPWEDGRIKSGNYIDWRKK